MHRVSAQTSFQGLPMLPFKLGYVIRVFRVSLRQATTSSTHQSYRLLRTCNMHRMIYGVKNGHDQEELNDLIYQLQKNPDENELCEQNQIWRKHEN
jgi:hypothetical protein